MEMKYTNLEVEFPILEYIKTKRKGKQERKKQWGSIKFGVYSEFLNRIERDSVILCVPNYDHIQRCCFLKL